MRKQGDKDKEPRKRKGQTKQRVNISIDKILHSKAQQKYPKQLSKLFEIYLKDIL
jgi:hypothetical protein